MFNRHIGLQLSYQVDPVTHYTIDYAAAGKAMQHDKKRKTHK